MKKTILFMSLCLALVMALTACGGSSDNDANDKDSTDITTESESDTSKQWGKADSYELGLQNKADGKYDEAIDAFKTSIDEDPENYLSYMELADIYIRKVEFVNAYEILNEGYNVTGNDIFQSKLIEFNSANVVCDSDNNPKGKTHFVDGKLSWYHEYVYDTETGLRKSVIYYGADGIEVSRIDIKFNGDKKPLTGYAYYTHTGEIEKLVFEYNGNGQLVKTNEYTIDGVLLGYSINSFDADGNKISEERFNADGSSHWKLEYIHDAAALESKRLTYFYGKLVGETNSTYNENGYSSGGSSRFKGDYDRTIEYDFDYEGNHERVEGFSSDIFYSRIICYCAELSILY